MQFKSNCRFTSLQPQAVVAMIVANEVYKNIGKDLVVTSVNDSTHMKGSFHYTGMAIDLRTNVLTAAQQQSVMAELRSRLTIEYDVILEVDHIHIEYDPKKSPVAPPIT